MKNKILSVKTPAIAFLVFLLLFCACYEFDFINQPGSVGPNTAFEVHISVNTTSGDNLYYIPYFGVLLPEGWTVEDSIGFTSSINAGMFIYSDSLVQEMNLYDPPPAGYFWWVSAGSDSVQYIYGDTYLFNPVIRTSNQSGTFSLDYMLGSSGEEGCKYLNHSRSDDHIITVGLPLSIIVTSPNNTGTGSLRAAIDSVDFYGTITFALTNTDTIFLEDQLSVYKDISIIGTEDYSLTISGNNAHRIFYINPQRSPVLSNISIVHGHCDSGGGIYCDYGSSPTLQNLTISNNFASYRGGGIYCGDGSSPTLLNLTISNNFASYGGGIFCYNSNTIIQDVIISGNSSVYYGGGIACSNNSNSGLSNVTITGNIAGQGGGIYSSNSTVLFDNINRCNIYLNHSNNPISYGRDLYSNSVMEVVVDTFTVLSPNLIYAYPMQNFTFDILHGKIQQVNADLYISPEGDNSNSGLSEDDPLKTIYHAFSIILADSMNQNTIHVLEGTYSPSTTGEFFPLYIPDYITLAGIDDILVILDADSTASVIQMNNNQSVHLTGMTIRGGSGNGIFCNNSSPIFEDIIISNNYGNGINCYNNSNPNFENVTITGNSVGISCDNSSPLLNNVTISTNSGNGISCNNNSCPNLANMTITGNTTGISCDNSSPLLNNVTISSNYSTGISCYNDSSPDLENVLITDNSGGISFTNSSSILQNSTISNNCGSGIACWNSSINLSNVTITGNSAEQGGGIHSSNSTFIFDSIIRCNIYLNNSNHPDSCGRDLYADSFMEVVVDTFTVLFPNMFYAYPLQNFTFDILHGKIQQVNADLYVSPDGDNTNSGLTEDDPLKTIYHAFSIILADSMNQNTIHLLEGTYSPSSNGEVFPVFFPDYLNLDGVAETEVIIDADTTSTVIRIENNLFNHLSGITITGGSGCGISCNNSDPIFENIIITNNNGNGIDCYSNSNPNLKNVTITNNTIGLFINNSNPILNNVTISNNYGSGLSCNNSSPTLENVIISGNSAYHGAGILSTNSILDLQDVTITENSADLGGGMYCNYSSIKLQNSVITGNIAQYHSGGGIYSSYSSLNLQNVVLAENSAATKGGAIYQVHDSLLLQNVTISANLAQNGYGLYCTNVAIVSVINSIIWNYAQYGIVSPAIITYSNIQGGWQGEGNIDEDPLFVGSGDHPYALSDGSPCIDFGTPDTMGLNLPPWDILGNWRIWDGNGDGVATVDMGAYEYGSIPVGIENPEVSVQSSKFEVRCYPNPFSNYTTFEYELKENAAVTLTIFNHFGKEDGLLVDEQQTKGTHRVQWNAKGLPAGVYYVQLKTGNQVMAKKIIKMK